MRIKTFLLSAGAVFLLLALGLLAAPATATAAPAQPALLAKTQHFDAAANAPCLACHNQPGMSVQLKSGEPLSLTIDATAFSESVHGLNNIPCVTCHTEISGFPHPERTVETLRDIKLKYYPSCQQCHTEQFNQTLDSVHQRALAAGNKNAAVCADCHNPHTQKPIADLPRSEIPRICSRCHSAIYNEYKESVHGSALTEGNTDVPTCVDCHGVHNITDPTTQTFRLKSPTEMCGKCHTDPAIMDKYGISTQVLNTYVADFHGTTVTIFQKEAPDQATNKPVCFDCHGVHNIIATDDPQKGLQVKANILKACQKCHPTVTTETFADAWMSHYIPSTEKYPIVYYVDLFYKFLIPAVLIPMGLLALMDFTRLMINRFRKPQHPDEAGHTTSQPASGLSPAKTSEHPKTTDEEALND